jgi:Damage-control phosphatase ARMT1-like domain
MIHLSRIPEVALDLDTGPVAVKGELPALTYPFTLDGIYASVPSLDAAGAARAIRRLVERVDRVVVDDLGLRARRDLPTAADRPEAMAVLAALLAPAGSAAGVAGLRLEGARPFPFRLASAAKLDHSFRWIDTNMKLQVEKSLLPRRAPAEACRLVAESALAIYSHLLKQEDHLLARAINFNHSMFLQDRILALLLGPAYHLGSASVRERGRVANDIALRYLEELGQVPERRLFELSVFMGTVWTAGEELQRGWRPDHPEATLEQVERQLRLGERGWGVDHVERFGAAVRRPGGMSLLVVLDDNGESMFDLAIVQQVVRAEPGVRATLLVNRYPVSDNISLPTLDHALAQPYFAELRRRVTDGGVTILLEAQPFRSFEPAYLAPATRAAIDRCDLLYVKGANFFETFQVVDKHRFHALAVHEVTSELLTGCPRGSGIVAELRPGQDGYAYRGPGDVTPLVEMLAGDGR